MDIVRIIETLGTIVQFLREIISGSTNGELSIRPIILISFLTRVDRIKSPPEISEEHRLGFANIPRDPDRVIRRQFLGMAKPSNSVCQTDDSLSFQIALLYLKKDRKSLNVGLTPHNILKIGNTIFYCSL